MRPNLLGQRPRPKPAGALVGQAGAPVQAGAGPKAPNTSPKLLPLLVLGAAAYYAVKMKRPTGEDQLVEMQRKQLAQGDRSTIGWWAVGYGEPKAKRFKTRSGPFASKSEAEAAAKQIESNGFYTEVAWGGDMTGDKEPLHEGED